MNYNLTLVTLTPGQIAMAKDANGVRKTITHALICGPHGQIFGTEKQCRKYWVAWDPANRPAIRRPQPGPEQTDTPGTVEPSPEPASSTGRPGRSVSS